MKMRSQTYARFLSISRSALVAAVVGVLPVMATAAPDAHLPPGIAWQQGDVNAAFALAKSSNKPLLLYWGAVWCPSCNQVKATVFSRQAFKERSSLFVPVYLDGDTANAQQIGERFKVHGYPTMILFRPDGTEITRLPGEADADRYLQALSLGLSATHPVRQTMTSALNGEGRLNHDEWRMLADYSWDTDGDLPVASDRIGQTLERLATRAQAEHASDESLRLELKALVVEVANDPKQSGQLEKPKATAALIQVLHDAKRSRAYADLLVADPASATAYLAAPGTHERKRLSDDYSAALARLEQDGSLSTIDRLAALQGRVDLAKLDTPAGAPLPKPLVEDVRRAVTDAQQAASNPFERQVVVTEGAELLTDAGLVDESDALLKASLASSPTPYYLMSKLALNAKSRGDKTGALGWYKQAYDASTGPASRLRWGASYVSGVIDLAPNDAARVQDIASKVLAQAAQTPNAFYGANRRALNKVVTRLAQWNKDGAHGPAVKALARQLEQTCEKLPVGDPQTSTCKALVQPIGV
ncbi:thioredoxin family protein [Trinickia sp. NRRL B-1857]|uniref:thioredoxin family protein n=1 Tax=Trinickia sp. NRRL B-1857 TaxID=3162879 RepID=UPI003D274096